MDWLIELFTTGGGVAHTVILYAGVIALGVFLGNRIKFGSVSLGVTWILFVGILAGDLLMRGGIEENTTSSPSHSMANERPRNSVFNKRT